MLLRGEPRREGPIYKRVFPPSGTPIEEKFYAATSRVLNEIADGLMAVAPDWTVLLKNVADGSGAGEYATRMEWFTFLKELAAAFRPDGTSDRRVRMGFRGHNREDKVQWVTVALLVRHYKDEERAKNPRGARDRAVERVAEQLGLQKRRIEKMCGKFSKIVGNDRI
jgi:hypothetical protein